MAIAICVVCNDETDVSFPVGIEGCAELVGTPVCPHHGRLWSDVAIEIRRSAQAKQADVLDADGVPIRVGDWVRRIDGDTGPVLAIERDNVDYPQLLVNYKTDGKTHSSPGCNRRLAKPSRSEAVHPTGCAKCGGAAVAGKLCNPCEESEKTTGGSGDAATREDAEAAADEAAHEHSPQPPVDSKPLHSGLPAGEQLKAFDAAVKAHLVPRLPKRVRVVCDTHHPEGKCARMVLWVLDGEREVWSSFYQVTRKTTVEEWLGDCAVSIASALMAAELGK